MTDTCTTCRNLNGKGSAHRNLGLYQCKALPVWTYISPFIERECKNYVPVPPSELQTRLDWEKSVKERAAA